MKSRFPRSVAIILLVVSSMSYEAAGQKCLFESCQCLSSVIQCVNTGSLPAAFPQRNPINGSNNFRQITIYKYNFNEIPDRAFENLTLDILSIFTNNLVRIGKNAFQGINFTNSLYLGYEDNFQQIEPDALSPLANKLKSLQMPSLKISDQLFTQFSSELQKITGLEKLNFVSNSLKIVPADAFKGLTSLILVNLGQNQLEKIDAGAFTTNTALATLDVSSNQLTSLEEIFKALKPVESSIRDVRVQRNRITSLTVQTNISTITQLELSNNQIEKFDNQSIVNTDALVSLSLSSNKLNFIDDYRLAKMKALQSLDVSKNYLARVPSILELNYLENVDLSNQNGQLKTIPDFTFERSVPTNYFLRINLAENAIEKFGDKAFCSRYFTPARITSLTLSYESMKNLDKCQLKPLSSGSVKNQISISPSTKPGVNASEVCNCDLFLFSKAYNLAVTGVCESIFTTLNCNQQNYQDPCKNQTQFDCVASFSSTSTETARVTTTTSSAPKQAVGTFYSFFVLFCLSVIHFL